MVKSLSTGFHFRTFHAVMVFFFLQTSTSFAQPAARTAGVQCDSLAPAGLAELLRQSKNQSLKLLFFSSWCSDCAVHLKNIKDTDTVLIGSFDKRDRIEKVVAKLGLSNACFMDAGVAERLGVKVVPAERKVTLADLHKFK